MTQSRSSVAQRKIACLWATLLESLTREREDERIPAHVRVKLGRRKHIVQVQCTVSADSCVVWPPYWCFFFLGWIRPLITGPTQNTMNRNTEKAPKIPANTIVGGCPEDSLWFWVFFCKLLYCYLFAQVKMSIESFGVYSTRGPWLKRLWQHLYYFPSKRNTNFGKFWE